MDLHDANAVIDVFRRKLAELTVQAVCGRRYVLVEKLRQWLKSTRPGCKGSYTAYLLFAAYLDWSGPSLPIPPETVSDECLLVFSILLLLNSGSLIHRFSRAKIIDGSLPKSLYWLRSQFTEMRLSDAENLAIKFDALQWRFCPARFDLNMATDHAKNVIIPVCRKQKIAKGGTAQVWGIVVQEEFVASKLGTLVSDSKFEDPMYGWCYEFALKTFDEGNARFYEDEKTAFDGLRNEDGMVRYLGDYSHQEVHPPSTSEDEEDKEIIRMTYNILLEYGESDLDEYFYKTEPPVLQDEIEAFWEGLFDVANTIKRMHNLKTNTDGVVQEYCGWHADIKPDNILNVQGKFKLADPGFAKFVKRRMDKVPTEILLGGTETYGAPERHSGRRETGRAVTQTIDIWSLGCVFSIAATWVVLGHQGIPQFRKMRQNAIDRLIHDQRLGASDRANLPVLTKGDYFHDGEKVLTDVKEWHKFLRSGLRKTDTITGRVLDLIEEKMLLGVGENRVTAQILCTVLSAILNQSKQRPRVLTPGTILEALYEVDREAPTNPTEYPPKVASGNGQLTQDRKTRKSKLLPVLKKTTHRSEYLKSRLYPQTADPATDYSLSEEYGQIQRPLSHDSGLSLSPPRPAVALTHSPMPSALHSSGQGSSTATLTSLLTQMKSKTSKASTFQDVFQAREAIEQRERGNLFHRTRKDTLLSQYFGDRDIKFLVDNAQSMVDHWYEATYLLETLVMKAAGQDDNGMDLAFTMGQITLNNEKSASKFKDAMKHDDARPRAETYTDMRRPLGAIFKEYLETLKPNPYSKKRKESPKNLTLIVLTDGKWEGMREKYDVDQMIVDFALEVQKNKGPVYRPVSIEFIQFGDDDDATFRLRRLDTQLKWQGVPDIVDTEPSKGDVNKMLLGSFVALYDEYGEESSTDIGPSLFPAQLMDPNEDPSQNDPSFPLPGRRNTGQISTVGRSDTLKSVSGVISPQTSGESSAPAMGRYRQAHSSGHRYESDKRRAGRG